MRSSITKVPAKKTIERLSFAYVVFKYKKVLVCLSWGIFIFHGIALSLTHTLPIIFSSLAGGNLNTTLPF